MESAPVHVLLIEDNPGDVRLIREMLKECSPRFQLEHCENLGSGLERLDHGGVDVLLLDLGLPDSSGLQTLLTAHQHAGRIPIVVLTGLADESVGVKAVQEGAQDYLVKGQVTPSWLAQTIRYAIERKKSEEIIKQAREVILARERRQAALAALGTEALGGIDFNQLFERTVSVVTQTLGVEFCGVLELLPDERFLIRAGAGRPGETISANSLAGCTLFSHTPIVVENLRSENRFTDTLLIEHGIQSGIAVVIGKADRPFGVLEALSRIPRSFIPDEVNFLQLVANLLGIAIQRKFAEDEINKLATTDTLTGLYNRRKLHEILVSEIHRARRYKTTFSLIMFDIDRFKRLNDTFGHSEGDRILQTIARLTLGSLRKTDSCARWGGEEFMILVPETNLKIAEQIAEKLRREIERHEFGPMGKITASYGVTEFDKDDDLTFLIKRVDDAMYRAKENGRNRVEVLEAFMVKQTVA